MYLRVEKLWRGKDDKWFAAPELINLDQVTRPWVTKDPTATDALFELNVAPASGVGTSTYYFGPGDMTEDEQGVRFEQLHNASRVATPVSWTKAQDDEAREAGRALDS